MYFSVESIEAIFDLNLGRLVWPTEPNPKHEGAHILLFTPR